MLLGDPRSTSSVLLHTAFDGVEICGCGVMSGGITATAFCSLMDWGCGWRWVFCSCAFLCLLGGLFLRLLLPKMTTGPSSAAKQDDGPSVRRNSFGSGLPGGDNKPAALERLSMLECSPGEQGGGTASEVCIELEDPRPRDDTDNDVSLCNQQCHADAVPQGPQALNAGELGRPVELFPVYSKRQTPESTFACSFCSCLQGAGTLQGQGPSCASEPPLEATQILPGVSASSRPEESEEEHLSICKGYELLSTHSQKLPFRLSSMILLCSCAYFFVKFVRYTLAFWLPFFLCRHCSLSVMSAGFSSMIFDVGGVMGAVLGGIVADRLLGGE